MGEGLKFDWPSCNVFDEVSKFDGELAIWHLVSFMLKHLISSQFAINALIGLFGQDFSISNTH